MTSSELKRMRRSPHSCWASLRDANSVIPWASFQVRLFDAIGDMLVALIGRGEMPDRRNVWLEWPTGHGKTVITAVVVAFVLAFSQRKVTGAIVDRSGAVRQALATLLEWNGWLADTIEISSEKRASNSRSGSMVRIFADQPALSACDFLIADSFADWPDGWGSTWAGAVSQAGCIFVTCSGGDSESWQASVRQWVRSDFTWHFDRIDHPVAEWSRQSTAERQRIISPADVQRLFKCNWGIADSAIDPDAPTRLNQSLAARVRRMNRIAKSIGLEVDCPDVDDDESNASPSPIPVTAETEADCGRASRKKRIREIAKILGLE